MAVMSEQIATASRGDLSADCSFSHRVWQEAHAKRSWVCLGLDVDLDELPGSIPKSVDGANMFLRDVIDVCADSVVAFKPNLAFYLALGLEGLSLLRDVREAVGDSALFILDGKVGDVPETSRRYAEFLFDVLDSDAVTFNAWLGWDSIEPLIERPDRGAFACVRTSNPDADDLQGLPTAQQLDSEDDERVFMQLARLLPEWDKHGNVGAVVGATRPDDVAQVRRLIPDKLILAPGVGAQGGALKDTVRSGFGPAPAGVLVNAGRSALWAGDGPDYAWSVCAKVEAMRDAIEAARPR